MLRAFDVTRSGKKDMALSPWIPEHFTNTWASFFCTEFQDHLHSFSEATFCFSCLLKFCDVENKHFPLSCPCLFLYGRPVDRFSLPPHQKTKQNKTKKPKQCGKAVFHPKSSFPSILWMQKDWPATRAVQWCFVVGNSTVRETNRIYCFKIWLVKVLESGFSRAGAPF